jgi:hypothetical protein
MSEAVQTEPEYVEDLGKLIAYIDEKLPPGWPEWPGGWPGQIEAALLDAVLSIRARYGSANTGVRAAVRRYKEFVDDDRPNSLMRLAGFDPIELGEVLKNRQVTGGASKATAVIEAAKRLNAEGVEQAADIPVAEVGARRTPEQQVRFERLKSAYRSVPGLGKVTFAYFTMLVGEPDVKADTWVRRFVAEAIGREEVSSTYTEQLAKAAAGHYGVDPRVLDHAIWVYMRTRSSEEENLARAYNSNRRVFDTSFDYKTDIPARANPDPDSGSPRLRADHELLWTKELCSGVLFAPTAPSDRREGYLIFTDTSGARHWYGSDAITSSYTGRSRTRSLADAIAGLSEDEQARYLNPPYTIGSSMIWPVRKKDKPTMNQARGLRSLIADRMDLTLECIRRHYTGEPESPLASVLNAYADFFALFDGFAEFVDFFHLQDLVTPDHHEVRFYLPFDNFKRSGMPATKDEYVTYREATLEFIARRNHRMAKWVKENHPEIEVRQ